MSQATVKEIDVICIGAINFDYIFSDHKFELIKKRKTISLKELRMVLISFLKRKKYY